MRGFVDVDDLMPSFWSDITRMELGIHARIHAKLREKCAFTFCTSQPAATETQPVAQSPAFLCSTAASGRTI
jgi:hypothetical protein